MVLFILYKGKSFVRKIWSDKLVSVQWKPEGEGVMSSMKKKYGSDKGESVFYATAEKKGMKPAAKPGKKMKKAMPKSGMKK